MAERDIRRQAGGGLSQQDELNDGAWAFNAADAASLGAFSSDLKGGAPIAAAPGIGRYQQIVFIEANVPDARLLAAGVAQGTLAVILNPNSDGVAQIATFLTSHRVSNLAAIDIVAHGTEGSVRLGTATLGSASLVQYQAELTAIGTALQTGGNIRIYGCDVAQDAAGAAFLDRLSAATGGANIAAASHLVGAASGGGSWDLNVNTGSIDAGSPFTAATEASYQGELVTPTAELWGAFVDNPYSTTGDTNTRIEQINLNGTAVIAGGTTDVASGAITATNTLDQLNGLVVDAPAGIYIASNSDFTDPSDSPGYAQIVSGPITPAGGAETVLYNAPSATNYLISGLSLDQGDGVVYFVQAEAEVIGGQVQYNGSDAIMVGSGTGLFKIDVTGTDQTATAVAVNKGFVQPGNGGIQPNDLAVDAPAGLAFLTDSDGVAGTVDNIDLINLNNGAVTTLNSNSAFASLDLNPADTTLNGVAVSSTGGLPGTIVGTLYLSSANASATAADQNFIAAVPFTVTSSGTVASWGTARTLYDGTAADFPGALTVDPNQGVLYVDGEQADATGNAIYEGSLSHTATATGSLTQIYQLSSASAEAGEALVLVSTPTIATGVTSGVTLAFTDSAVADPTLALTNEDLQGIATATIQITGSLATGDTLSAPVASGITQSYTAGTGSLTLTGTQVSLSGWQTELDGVTFSTAATTTHSTRTLTWQVGDGVNTSSAITTTAEVICFCAGTLIGTQAGQVPVDKLAIGDLVLTAHGGPREVKWIGQGKVLATRGKPTAATPVIVRKGALSDNVPTQDLYLTKAHSLYIDDVLIPVEFLINYKTILWDDRAGEVEIYHVELDSHDVLLANGAPAESFRDDGNRWLFQNARSGWGLPPQEPYAAVLTGGPVVDAAWRRLLDRAGPRDLPPLTDDPDLHLIVDGVRVDPQGRQGSRYVFRLPCCPSSVVVGSRTGVPAELGIVRDPRSLGVALRQVTVQQGAKYMLFDADDERLTTGFHGYEPSDCLRWTDGHGELPVEAFSRFDRGAEVTLHLGGATRYPGHTNRAARDAA